MRILLALIFLLIPTILCAKKTNSPKKNPNWGKVELTQTLPKIHGKPTFILSGSFHYFRVPKSEWKETFRLIKAAGLNCVETSVPWNIHEPTPPPNGLNDFSAQNFDLLEEWIKMAHDEFGLYTIIRIGPYVGVEWSGGGFPRWLIQKSTATKTTPWLRSSNPEYLRWANHWISGVGKCLAPHQISQRKLGKPGGIILCQIENEYDFWENTPQDQRVDYLTSLVEFTKNSGISIPLITSLTAQTRNSQKPELSSVIDGVNAYPGFDFPRLGRQLEQFRQQQPGKTLLIPELQGGWYGRVGGQLPENQLKDGFLMNSRQIQSLLLTAIHHRAGIVNISMFRGGTNWNDGGARFILSSYDFLAPIRENGQISSRYLAVCEFSKTLNACGNELILGNDIPITKREGGEGILWFAREGKNGDIFIFACREGKSGQATGKVHLSLQNGREIETTFNFSPNEYKLLKVYSNNEMYWLPYQPADTEKETPFLQKITPTEIEYFTEPSFFDSKLTTNEWKNFTPTLFKTKTFPCAWRSRFLLSQKQANNIHQLRIQTYQNDRIIARINGHILYSNSRPDNQQIINISGLLKPGENFLEFIDEDEGQPSWGAATELKSGIHSAFLLEAPDTLNLQTWEVAKAPSIQKAQEYLEGKNQPEKWWEFHLDHATINELNNLPRRPLNETDSHLLGNPAAGLQHFQESTAVYRTKFGISKKQLDEGICHLNILRVDDQGSVVVNGNHIGEIPSWNEPFSANISQWLKEGMNEIGLIISNKVGPGGLTGLVNLSGNIPADEYPIALEFLDAPSSFSQEIWNSKKLAWEKDILPFSQPAQAPLHWYRINFEVPENDTTQIDGLNPAWMAKILAKGNGFIWFNGKLLGRYWEQGPQHNFYIPRNWLEFSTRKKSKINTLTIALMPIGKTTGIELVEFIKQAPPSQLLLPAATPKQTKQPHLNTDDSTLRNTSKHPLR